MAYDVEVVEPKLFAGVVADEITFSINDAIHDRGSCSVILAGGKTPSVIYRTLSKPPRVTDVDWQKVKFFLGDERWVAPDDMQSNFKMVNETLLSFLPRPGPSVYPLDTSGGDPAVGATKYSQQIAAALGIGPGERPIFDLVLLGVGEDGHTASVFPRSPVFDSQPAGSFCAAVPGPKGEGWRVTIMPQALFEARKILFIVRGDNKAAIVRRVLEGDDDAREIPARLFVPVAKSVTWFIDSAAAQQLKPR